LFNPAIPEGEDPHTRMARPEPALWIANCSKERLSPVRPRNRFYVWGDDLPTALLGPNRDPDLFEQDNPANRAIRNAERIQSAGLPIYLECGDNDALLFQDGAEFLHRVLWDLDLSHEFRLTAGADHVGPTLLPRLRTAFLWLGECLAPPQQGAQGPAERAWAQWLAQGGMEPQQSMPLDPGTRTAQDLLRRQVAEPRAKAAQADPTTHRRFGRLPDPGI
jgi:S-formylglutathione hydrolase